MFPKALKNECPVHLQRGYAYLTNDTLYLATMQARVCYYKTHIGNHHTDSSGHVTDDVVRLQRVQVITVKALKINISATVRHTGFVGIRIYETAHRGSVT